MEQPQFSIEHYNKLQTNKQKSGYLRYLANKLDEYDSWVLAQEESANEALKKANI